MLNVGKILQKKKIVKNGNSIQIFDKINFDIILLFENKKKLKIGI